MIVGFTHGVFDLLHPGHLYLFQQASHSCDYLIVGVNSDASVKRLKGPLRPAESLMHRMQRIHECATRYVGAVVPFEGDKYAMLKNIAPRRYLLGYDQVRTRTTDWMMGEINCELRVIDHLPGYSTSLQLDAARSKTNA